ncbi:MAG: hypothetical protein Kow0042_10630 [Calditrichia bacterium]
MDYGRFRYDSSFVYLEIYYNVFAQDLEYITTEEGTHAEVILHFNLSDAEKDSLLAEQQITVNFAPTSPEAGDLVQGTVGVIKTVLRKGKYSISMFNESDTLSYDLSVGPFKADRITMSDLELASNIITKSTDVDNPFYKNTMIITPNPSLVYGKNLPRLYYYLELYNLMREGIDPSTKILVQAVIADGDGNIRLKKEYYRDHSHESSVEIGAFNVSRLESGLYTLIFAVTDSADNSSVYRRQDFYIHNPDVVLASVEEGPDDYLDSEFRDMPESILDEMFAQARYIATRSELNVWKVLNTVESKREFLFRFWKTREKERPGWKDEYYERVEYANQQFRVGTMEGWESDMGRVYILYGPPSEEKHFPSGPNENPYEIWYYHDLEGGVEFDFVDLNGFGIYRLVNSTKRDEINYPDWENYIYTR